MAELVLIVPQATLATGLRAARALPHAFRVQVRPHGVVALAPPRPHYTIAAHKSALVSIEGICSGALNAESRAWPRPVKRPWQNLSTADLRKEKLQGIVLPVLLSYSRQVVFPNSEYSYR